MKAVRGRADARWLPSRFNFALFRLFAYVRMRNARAEPGDVALIVDRNQNPIESFMMSVWVPLTVACYVAGSLSARPSAILAAIPIALVLVHIPIIVMGALVMPLWHAVTGRRIENVVRVSSTVMMTLFLAAAIWFARSPSWARFVAWHVLILVGLNTIAAGVVFLLRGGIADLERAVGGLSSEL